MKKRLLALLLVLVIVVGLFPTTAFAAGEVERSPSSDNVSALSTQDSYSITFLKDAFNMTQISVTPVDGTSPTPVKLKSYITSTVTLDNSSFSVGDGVLTLGDLLTGYGLLYVETKRQTPVYYFQYATWGIDGDQITEISYDDVVAHAEEGLYLHYRVPEKSKFTVTAVDENNRTIATHTEMKSGAITTEVAQKLLADQGVTEVPYYFDHAELRAVDKTNTTVIPFDNIRLLNGYFYVSSNISSHAQDAFNSKDWNVYFVYESAYTLTLNVSYSDGAGTSNLVNGVYLTEGVHTYEIPKHSVLELPITIEASSNLTVTETTGGSNKVLFDSVVDGYQIKEYALTFSGEMLKSDPTVTVAFTGVSSGSEGVTLEYSHYVDSPNSYHGNEVLLFPGGGETGTALDRSNRTTTIRQGDVLRFYCNAENATYMVNTLVFNGTALKLPTWSWTGSGDHNGSAETIIYDSAGHVMARVTTNVWIRYTSSNAIEKADFYIKFNELNNNIKLDRANLAPKSYPDLIIYEMGDGLDVQYYNELTMNEGEKKEAPIGCGIYPYENDEIYVTPKFGYYVTRFRMGTDGAMLASKDTAATWYGYKEYSTVDGASGTPNKTNRENIINAGSSPGYIESDLIDFTLKYDWDGTEGGAYYTDGSTFTLGLDKLATPLLDSDLQPPSPVGKTFVGWSLTATKGGYTEEYYIPGQTIPREVIAANADAITYGETGKATINLYPVFQEEATSPYVDYTVTIHSGGKTATFAFSGGIFGASLDRDSVLALPDIAEYLDTLSDVVMNGARSDSMVELTRRGNEFHLYFDSTLPVTITFVSQHGFRGETGTTTKVTTQNPATVMEIPTPHDGESVNATFIGWSLDESATAGVSLTNALVPYEDTTYYAVFAPGVTLTFYSSKDGVSWNETPTEVQVLYNQSLTSANQAGTVTDLQKTIPGYNFSHWAQNAPYGTQITSSNLLEMSDFSGGTIFYAVYTPTTNNTVTFHGNGGTWGTDSTSSTNTVSNLTFGTTYTPDPPDNHPEDYTFVGWGKQQSEQYGPSTIVVGESTDYYALWMRTALDVEVLNAGNLVYDGTPKTPDLRVTWNGAEMKEYDVVWSNNVNAGTASVTVTHAGTTGYATFTINQANLSHLSEISAVLDGKGPFVFNGFPHTPGVIVTDTRRPTAPTNEQTLVSGKDYAVSYTKNTDVGGVTVTVAGQGNYTGSKTIEFQIVNTGITLAVAPMPDYIYNSGSKPRNFTYVVYDTTNNRVLLEGDDYEITGLPTDGNWSIARHMLTVEGKNNYIGLSTSASFHIVAAGELLEVAVTPTVMPNNMVDNPKITVTLSGNTTPLIENQDYTLQYQWYNESTRNLESVDDLKQVGMYVIVAIGRDGTEYAGARGYGNFARLGSTAGEDLTVGLTDGDSTVLTYNGTNHWDSLKSKLTVKDDMGEPVTDYTYTVSDGKITSEGSNTSAASFDMTNAGTYTVTITGAESHSGKKGTLYIYVNPRNLGSEGVTVTPDPDIFPGGKFEAVYDGAPHNHPFTITDRGLADSAEGKILTDADYEVAFHNHDAHKDVGTYPVVINGKGNYTGSQTILFSITPKPLTVSSSLKLDYGYTTYDLSTHKAEAMEDVLEADKSDVDVHLYVDAALPVGANQQHIHGYLTGSKAGNYELEITGTVTVNAVSFNGTSVTMSVLPDTGLYNGEAHHPTVYLTYNGNRTLSVGTDYELHYYKSEDYDENSNDYTQNDLGADGMKEAGEYTILAVGKGSYEGKLTGTYTIHPANYNDVFVSVNPKAAQQTYTGGAITLTKDDLVVTRGSGATVPADEYKITNHNNNVNVGTATITVKVGGITGTGTFEIVPKDLSDAGDLEISVTEIGDKEYTGSAITPVPTITYKPNGGSQNTLQNQTDFYLMYRNNVQAGTATIVITGSGNYSGSREVMFQINYAPATLSFYTWTATDGWTTDARNNIQISYGSTITTDNATAIGKLAVEIPGYEFAGWAKGTPLSTPISLEALKQENSFSTNTAFYAVYTPKQITVTLDSNDGTSSTTTHKVAYGTVLKETATRTGYTFAGWSTKQNDVVVGDMSITVPAADTTYYAVWLQTSLAVTVTSGSSFVYNGSPQRPNFTVTDNNGNVLSGSDYTVQWSGDGINAGTYGFTVTADNGSDTGFGTYTIAPKPITAKTVTVSRISDVTYSGSDAQPLLTISDSETSKDLVLNTDFTVGYSDNTEVGQATVTIGGIGNYTDTPEKHFTIQPYDGTFFIAPIPDQTYTGSAITITDLVVYDNNGNVVPSSAYTPSYSNNTAIGTATVTITGNKGGNYDGASGAADFCIVGGSGSGNNLTVTVNPQQAPVNDPDPTISVTMGSTSLGNGDYTLSYEVYSNGMWSQETELTNAGMYRITATGANNYAGTSGSAIFVRTPADTSSGGSGDGSGKFTIGGLNSHVLTYNGTDQHSVLDNMTVTAGENTPLKKDIHYTVTVLYNDSTTTEMTNVGAYTVLVQGKDNYAQSSASTTIYIQPKDISDQTVSVSGLDTTVVYDGDAHKPASITVTDSEHANIAANTDYTISYGSGDYTDAGIYTVTITGKGNYTGYRTATCSITPKTLTVSDDVTLTYGYTNVDLSAQENQAATGVVANDSVVVNLYMEPGLEVNADGYEDALKGYLSGADAHNYTLTITGKVIVNTTTIIPPDGGTDGDADNRFVMIVSPGSGSFTGQTHTPTILVTHNNQVLTPDTDYTLTYTKADGSDETVTEMVDVGTYTITANGKASYDGSISGTYEIVPDRTGSAGGLEVALAAGESGTYTYTGSAIEPKVTVSFNDNALNAGDYSVEYSFNTDVGEGLITVNGTSTNYQGMSSTLTFPITAKSIADISITVAEIEAQTYTGSAIEPKPMVTDTARRNSVALKQGVDYYVAYTNNVQVGLATVTITGMGNYTGTTQKSFPITAAGLGDGSTTPGAGISVAVYPATGVFTGLPHYPNVIVTHGGMKLEETRDYSLSYKNADGTSVGKDGLIDVGTYTITVTGTGNYSGSVNTQYMITRASGGGTGTGGGSTLAVDSIGQQTYTGSAIQPAVTVRYNGNVVDATNYDVTYSANTNAGQATVLVTGKADTSYENMVGTTTFTIVPKSITGADIDAGSISNQTYTGSAITPETTLNDTTRNTALIKNADYILGYKKNVDVGTATMVITGRGNYTGEKTVTFEIVAANLGGDSSAPGAVFTMDIYPASGPYTAEKHDPVVVIHYNNQLLEETKDYTLTYTKADGSDETVTEMVNVGTYTITATGIGNYTGTVSKQYTITQADSTKVLVIAPISNVEYTGTQVEPSIRVTYGGNTLQKDRDYTVSYTGDRVNAGLVVVTVTGQGATYGGLTATAAFQITHKAIDGNAITVSALADQTYTGGNITPAVTITDGGQTLVLNRDYAVEYSNNLNQGTANVTIRGIGNYASSRTTTFTITRADVGGGTGGIAVNVYPASGVFNGAAHNPAILVTHGATQLVLGRDYTVSGNENMINVGTYMITITGTGNYSGTQTVSYRITTVDSTGGSTLNIAGIDSVTYDGQAQEPKPTVSYQGENLAADTDYSVEYQNNTDAGFATVIVTGKGDYAGMVGSATFQINPRSIEDGNTNDAASYITISGVNESYTYTGAAILPTVTVQDTELSRTLTLNSDYTVSYGTNVTQSGTVTIKGNGNFTGTVVLTFTISPDNSLIISGINESYTYTGSTITSNPTVRDGSGRQLVKGVDYQVTYQDNLNVGTATVTITGLGVYGGQEEVETFQITAKLLYLDVTVTPESAVHGDGTTPTISVALDGTTLTETEHYTLSYQKYSEDGTLIDADAEMSAPGMYVITATGADDSDYAGAMGSATFVRVPDGGDLIPSGGGLESDSNIITRTFSGEDHSSVLDGIKIRTEGGSEVTVTKTEISYNNGALETLDEDYEIINAGIYTVTYTAKEGTADVIVVINPKDINDPTVTVNGLGENDYTYDGTEQSPNVTLTDSVYSIEKGKDYSLVADSQTKAGTYSVEIKGSGNYTGYRFENFIINQKPITVETLREIEYTCGYDGPIELEKEVDYSVEGIIEADESGVSLTMTVPKGLGADKHTIAPLLSGEQALNYTVSGGVTITVNPMEMVTPGGGDGGDGDGDGVVDPDKDNDNDGNIEDDNGDGVIETTNGFKVTMTPTSGTFNSKPHTPTVTVTYKQADGSELTLLEGVDYTVTYLDSDGRATQMIQVGSYTVRITAIGNYKGGFDLTYTIAQGSGPEGGDGDSDGDGNYEDGNGDHVIEVGGFWISLSPYSGYHNGQAHNPKVTAKFTVDGTATTLIENVDFTVAYYGSDGSTSVAEMIDVGTYTVRVSGIDNYAGNTFDLSYDILSMPSGGGGGSTTTDPDGTDKPDGSENDSGVMNPDQTGVSNWLNTSEHNAYLRGYPGNQFGPNNNMTRAEVAQMFYNLLLEKDVPITVSFDDVAADAWYARAVNTLASLGIINGVGNNLSDPERSITRAEFTTIAMRFADLEVSGENIFPDVTPDDWFYGFVVGAVQYGWINGYPNGNFGPNDTITRGEVTAIVNRMLERSADESYVNNHENAILQFGDVSRTHWAYYQIVEATNAHDYTKNHGKETWTGLK